MVKNLESKVTELRTELESKDVQMQGKVTELEAKVEELVREKKQRNAAADYSDSVRQINQSEVSINGLPSSCGDLKMIGHIWSGFYSVMGSAMIESVYCDFSKIPGDPGKSFSSMNFILNLFQLTNFNPFLPKGFEKWIGYVDVKLAPVHFYVQRNTEFNTKSTPIPFDLAVVNEANAMNLASGIFMAPVTGIYYFSFTGVAEFPASSSRLYLIVGLYLNGDNIGRGDAQEANTVSDQYGQLTAQLTLNLKKGDQIWLQITDISSGVNLYDDNYHYTHFTGFMLQEEIVALL